MAASLSLGDGRDAGALGTNAGALGTRLCTQGCGASLGQHRAPQDGNKSLAFSDLALGSGGCPPPGKERAASCSISRVQRQPCPLAKGCGMAFAISFIYILSVTQVSERKQSLLFTHLLPPHQCKAVGKQSSQIKILAPILGKSR